MTDIVARIRLPQRVPYGLHGSWFSEEEVLGQRPYTGLRRLEGSPASQHRNKLSWSALINAVEAYIA